MTPQNHFQALRRYWLLVLACMALGLAAAFGASSLTLKSYVASAQLVVNVAGGDSQSDVAQGADYTLRQMPTYVGMANTAVVLEPVIKELQLATTVEELAGRVSADSPLNTTIIAIAVEDGDPKRAADTANAVVKHLGEVLRSQSPAPRGDKVIAPSVLTPATAPTIASSPSRTVSLAVGLLGGLAIGWLAAALLWSRKRGPRAEPGRAGDQAA